MSKRTQEIKEFSEDKGELLVEVMDGMNKKDKEIYPCIECGKMRSENQGGKIFTCCDECFEKADMSKKEIKAIDKARSCDRVIRKRNPTECDSLYIEMIEKYEQAYKELEEKYKTLEKNTKEKIEAISEEYDKLEHQLHKTSEEYEIVQCLHSKLKSKLSNKQRSKCMKIRSIVVEYIGRITSEDGEIKRIEKKRIEKNGHMVSFEWFEQKTENGTKEYNGQYVVEIEKDQ